jgi:hypothetical protein
MAGETESRLDPVSEAARKAEAQRKADMSDGKDTVVPRGDEAYPGGKRDAASDRKAIYERTRQKRAAEETETSTNNGEVESYQQAMSDEMAVRLEAESRGENPDEAHRKFVANGHKRPGDTQQAGAQRPVAQTEPTYATIAYQGRQISVSSRDIEAAGGEANYLRARELEDASGRLAAQAAEMTNRRAALDAAEADLNRRREEAERSPTGAQGAPAIVPVSTQGQGSDPAASAESVQQEAERLTNLMFSGDPADATKALAEVLTAARSSRMTMTAEQLAELAAKKLREQFPEATQPRTETPRTPVVDPIWEQQRIAINEMGAREYPELSKDPSAAARVRDRIQQSYADPRNKDRRAIDVAREACEIEKQEMLRQTRVEVKQGLPSAPSAGGAAPPPTEDKPATGSDYVALLRSRRDFSTKR